MDNPGSQSIFGPLGRRIRDIPRTRESAFSYASLIIFIILLLWMFVGGFMCLFRINIFWDTGVLVTYIVLIFLNLLISLYSAHLNTKRLVGEEHDRYLQSQIEEGGGGGGGGSGQ